MPRWKYWVGDLIDGHEPAYDPRPLDENSCRTGPASTRTPSRTSYMRLLIECLTDPGDVVVNPAAGGFSTLDAALSVGRHFLGCEFLPENHPALKP
jgi:hypothetical protein